MAEQTICNVERTQRWGVDRYAGDLGPLSIIQLAIKQTLGQLVSQSLNHPTVLFTGK
jgi:hypothetical protein